MIQEAEYKKRRDAFGKKLKPNSLSVIFSAKAKQRSNDTEYPYRQDSNFYYLSGFKEDNSFIVIYKEKKKCESYLFVQKKDKTLELWTGKRLGQKKAKEKFSFDAVYTSDEYEDKLLEMIKRSKNLYYDFRVKDERVVKLQEMSSSYLSFKNIAYPLGMLRLIKSNAEIELIQQALKITKEAHHRAMSLNKKGLYEFELQADIEHTFKSNGSYSDAYTSIVACANAANTLHYISNDKKLKEGELILIDAGCEYEYYSSDITRTIPTSAAFSEAQRDLYEMVLDVEKKIIQMIKPDILRTDLQKESEKLLCEGMLRLGILKGKLTKLLKQQAHKKYYPHGIGHWMGLDVHDESPYKDKKGDEIPLMAGMVMTIEPGIYIDKNDKTVPKKYRGIGIRIEDDILVTQNGYENLSKDILKEIVDIEALNS